MTCEDVIANFEEWDMCSLHCDPSSSGYEGYLERNIGGTNDACS